MASGCGIVFVEDRVGNRLLRESLAGLESASVIRLVVVDVEAEDVPILDRVGDGVGLPGTTSSKEWTRLAKEVRRRPHAWVAQRRFVTVALEAEGERSYPCIGVYTIDGSAIGAYGRVARRPLIDWRAQDAAVLAVHNEDVVEGSQRA